MTTVTDLACMGGFKCAVRDSCRHYHAEDRSEPNERLCANGRFNAYAPLIRERDHAVEHHALALVQGVA